MFAVWYCFFCIFTRPRLCCCVCQHCIIQNVAIVWFTPQCRRYESSREHIVDYHNAMYACADRKRGVWACRFGPDIIKNPQSQILFVQLLFVRCIRCIAWHGKHNQIVFHCNPNAKRGRMIGFANNRRREATQSTRIFQLGAKNSQNTTNTASSNRRS